MKRIALLVALAAALSAPTVATAQGGPGFLFKKPSVSLGVRVGWMLPRTNGELFGQTLDQFIPLGADTLSSLSFDSPYVGGELSIRPWDRWDLAVGFSWTRSRSLSEYRRFIDSNDSPIQQETTFQVVSGTVGAKYYLQDRGRRVGRLAWVPRRLSPFVGGGIGVASYEFRQAGDFVDTSTLAIFTDNLVSESEGFMVYGTGGVDVTLAKNAIVTAEARYSFSNADVAGSYGGFNDIDLTGLQLMIGLGFQF